MARTATKAAAQTETNEATEDTLEFEHYLDKEPSETHEFCKEWLDERTGYELDLKTVQIVLSLYSKFQRSPENQEMLAEKKAAAAENKAAREKRAAERAEKAKDEDAAPVRRSSRKVATGDDAEDSEETPAPTRARRGRAAAKATEPEEAPAPKRTTRRRPAAKAENLD